MILKTNKIDRETELIEKRFIKELETQYTTAYKNVKKEVLEAYGKYSKDGVLTYTEMTKYDRLTKLMNNIDAEVAKLNRGMYSKHLSHTWNIYSTNHNLMGDVINEGLGISKSFGIINRDAVIESLLTPLDKGALEDLTYQTRKRLRDSITQSLIKGEGIRPMTKSIANAIDVNANRAVRIARTETVRVMNKARLEVIQKAETETVKLKKRWVATTDGRTRDTHRRLNRKTVGSDEDFKPGLAYPGDPRADPSETVNCRCSLATEVVIDD